MPEGPPAEGRGDPHHGLRRWTSQTFGGGFIYGFTEDRISVGLVVGLDYRDPFLDPHALFQQLQGASRCVRRLLEGGKMLRYGARTISEGGWYSIPRPYADGVLLVGEAAGYLNAQRLKGIHLAHQDGDAGRGDGARGAAGTATPPPRALKVVRGRRWTPPT